MTFREFLAEIKTSMRKYDNQGLIDETSIRIWVEDELKRFGQNLMVTYKEIVDIKNGRIKLPPYFWNLNRLYLCEVEEPCDEDDSDIFEYKKSNHKKHLQSERWTIETTTDRKVESCYSKDIHRTTNVITERLYFSDGIQEVNYNLYDMPKIVKKESIKGCIKGCPNVDSNSENTVMLNGKTLFFNFTDGKAYIEYIGLEVDEEENEIVIPETQHNRLKVYLENFIKAKILEDLINNAEVDGGVEMFKYYTQSYTNAFPLAMTEIKAEAMGGLKAFAKLRNYNRREMLKYDIKQLNERRTKHILWKSWNE